jgi:hypothetical protein
MDNLLAAQLINWANETDPALREQWFQVILKTLEARPDLVRALAGSALAAYEAHLARTAVIGIGARLTVRQLLPRLIATFGAAPKGPHPVLIGVAFIGSALLVGCSAQSELAEMEASKPSYQLYVQKYLMKCLRCKQLHPGARLESPQDFETWYAENRT